MSEALFTNGRIVTADRAFDGTVLVRDNIIAAVETGKSSVRGSIDLGGDYLVPGLVELHTDNLEGHFAPRPGVRWPSHAAVVAHDAQIAAAGITTVFDALALGDIFVGSERVTRILAMCEGLSDARRAGILRADHFLHLRCELSYAGVQTLYEQLMDDPALRLVSIMDHTPGQRQFVDLEKFRIYYRKRYELSESELEGFIMSSREAREMHGAGNRRGILERSRRRRHVLASHDDATTEHVAEAAADGMTIAEFPTTRAAAQASRRSGLAILMGAPNIVLGGSQSGNVAVRELVADDLLDILSSDYVPSSLLHAAFLLAEAPNGLDLAAAIRLVTRNPAQAAGLADRGEIAPGLRADLVRVRCSADLPLVRAVWRGGERIV